MRTGAWGVAQRAALFDRACREGQHSPSGFVHGDTAGGDHRGGRQPVSGTIAKLNADYNSKVSKGQVVAQLDQARFAARVEETRANVLAAQANLAKAKVALEDAERNLKRAKELKQRELVAQSELDAAQTAHDSARSQVNVTQAQVGQAQASMNQAQIDLGYTIIRSPVDGIVISRSVDVARPLRRRCQRRPSSPLPMISLRWKCIPTSTKPISVTFLKARMSLSPSMPTRNGAFRGKVHQVRNAPQIIQNVVTYNSVVRINNKELLLKPGMTANVQFLVAQKEDALTIPNIALRFRPPRKKTKRRIYCAGAGTNRTASRSKTNPPCRRRRWRWREARRVRQVKVYTVKDARRSRWMSRSA
jgi:HlyD family secretion protein